MALIDDLIRSGVANVYAQGTSPPRPPRGVPNTGFSRPMQAYATQFQKDFPGVALTSGYRSPEYNRSVGGARGSQHTHGNAMDVSLRGLNDTQKAAIVDHALANGAKGIGYYKNSDSLHIDFRSGGNAAWGQNRSRTSLPDTPRWFQERAYAHLGGKAPPERPAGAVAAKAVREQVKPGETPLPQPRPEPQGKIASTDAKSGRVANIQTDDVPSPRPRPGEPPAKAYAPTPPARAEAPAQRAISRAAGPPAGLQAGGAPAGRSQLAQDIIKGYGPAGAGLTTYREPGTGREIITGSVDGNSIMRDVGRTQPMAPAAPRAVKSASTAAPPPAGMPPIAAPEGVPLPRPRPADAPAVAPPGPSATDFPAVGFELGEGPRAGAPDINAPDFNFETGVGKVDPIAENRARIGLYKYGPQGRADPLSGGPMSPKRDDRLLSGSSTSDAPSITPAFADRFDSSTIFSPTPMANQAGPGGKLSAADLRDFLTAMPDRFAPAPGSISPPPPSTYTPGGGPSPQVGAPMPAYAGPSSLNTPAGPSPSAAAIGTAQAAPLLSPQQMQQLPWWMQQNMGWWTPNGMWGGGGGSPVTFGGDFSGGGVMGGAGGGW